MSTAPQLSRSAANVTFLVRTTASETYSEGPNGVVVANGATFAAGTPTTATLPDGNVVNVTPGASVPLVSTGLLQGETYCVGPYGIVVINGATFATGTPTTATLPDGKVVQVTPGATAPLVFFQGETYSMGLNGVMTIDGTLLATGTPTRTTLANGEVFSISPGITPPPAQTGIFQGESYSVGSNGVVVIGGTTFATRTPTTATLTDGKVIVV